MPGSTASIATNCNNDVVNARSGCTRQEGRAILLDRPALAVCCLDSSRAAASDLGYHRQDHRALVGLAVDVRAEHLRGALDQPADFRTALPAAPFERAAHLVGGIVEHPV